jgi:hypothetical protein
MFLSIILSLGVYLDKTYGDDKENELEIRWVLPPKYNRTSSSFSSGRIWAQEKEKGPWILFDDKGNIIKDGVEARIISGYENGLAYFRKDANHYGFFDLSGDVFSLISSDKPLPYSLLPAEGLLQTRGDNGLYGFTGMSCPFSPGRGFPPA